MIDFALGFLCACAFIGVSGYFYRLFLPVEVSKSSGGEPVSLWKVKEYQPDNEKALRYATEQYRREKEEEVTRGAGFPE